MRVAFFGGSFDPPHLGHLHIALTASARLRLDRVLLAPVGRQPLKSQEAAPFADRLAMLQLLTAHAPHLEASSIDGPLAGDGPASSAGNTPNYSVDTLARLRSTLPPGAELFFLAGADSFLTLPHWHRPEALLQPALPGPAKPGNAELPQSPAAPGQPSGSGQPSGLLDGWILAARPGFPLDALGSALPPGYQLVSGQRRDLGAPAHPVLLQPLLQPGGQPGTPLYLLPDLEDPSTATSIRAAFAHGRPAPHLPAPILAYIRDHGLYRMLG
jgi:nicotinate-nucleotide adenylyltransferase